MMRRATDNCQLHWTGDDGRIHKISYRENLLVWKVLKQPGTGQPPAMRGTVTSFTKAARWRMIKTIAAIDFAKASPCLFITLTCSDDLPYKTGRQLTQYRSRFWRYVEHFAGQHVGALWRLEWKVRQSGRYEGTAMPHFHLLTFGVGFIPYREVNLWWKSACNGIASRTEVTGLKNAKQVGTYVAKYAAKVEAPSLVNASYLNRTTCGRQWGILRKNKIPWKPETEIRIAGSRSTEVAIRSSMRILQRTKNDEGDSFTLLGPNACLIWTYLVESGLVKGEEKS